MRTTILATVQLERDQQLQLKRVLGLPADVPLDLHPGITLPIDGEPPEDYELFPLLDYRFDLQAQRRAFDSQDQAYRAAVEAQVPATVVSGARARDTGNVGTWGAGVAVDIPLFDRNQGNVALQRATRDKLYDQYVQTVFEARSDVSIAVTRLRVLEEQIDATQLSVQSQNQLVETYEKLVEEGSGNVLLYYQAFNDLAQSRVQLIQLQRDFIDAWITLENAVGDHIPMTRTEPAETITPLEEALQLELPNVPSPTDEQPPKTNKDPTDNADASNGVRAPLPSPERSSLEVPR
ncbi:MAG: hypothetical protein KatS3mg105_5079 [Gemmatales bacterium]|nr:MAG: hypothetical protein KatS3mg105_5079 [Gemmatales bacterium]